MISNLWRKSNIVTFMGIAFSIVGICLCFLGNIKYAIVMLMLGGICDGFDGPIARRINKEANPYGVQIDSLADIVGSGVLPVCICLAIGYRAPIDMAIYVLFVICGITRLSYYNVNGGDKDSFSGMPITFSTMLLPWMYVLCNNEIAFMIGLTLLSIAYVSGLKVKKPSMKVKIALSIGGAILGIAILFFI